MYKANNNFTALAKALYNTNKSFRTCANICVVFLQTHRAEGASNCVERHLNLNGRDTSLIWTYSQVGRKCCFHSQSVALGDPRSRVNNVRA